MLERLSGCLALGVNEKADRPELHFEYGVMPVPAMRCCGQPQDVSGLHLREHALERDCRYVVALVHDHVPIRRDPIIHATLANQALEHRNIQGAVVTALPASDPSNLRLVDSKKHRQLGDPLIEERTAMDKDQGVSATLRQEVRCQDRFPQTWRRDEHPDVMLQESLGCALLNRRELAVKSQAQPYADVSLVFHAEDDAVFAAQIFDLFLASGRPGK